MAANDRIFISHAHADNDLCKPILDALKAWEADYWFDTRNAAVGHVLLDEIMQAMRDCDVFIRICTSAASTSPWMHRELGMYLAYQDERKQRDLQHKGKLITMRFPGYDPDVFDQTYLYIDTTPGPEAAWLDGLRRALGKPMGWVKSDHSDADYLWWANQYPEGYIVSADRRPKQGAMMLHRVSCGHFKGNFPAGAFTERGYIKIGALDPADLDLWARTEVEPTATLMATCNCMVYGYS